MYQPPMFREDRTEIMHALMQAHMFATLVSSAAGRLTADHVPLVLHADEGQFGVLRGHLAIANPLFRENQAGGEHSAIDVLAIFQGPQAYVTPSWYPSKAEHGKVVPTWNYAVVHAHGTLRFHRDGDWLAKHLGELTARNEKSRAEPWAVNDAPAEFLARQFRGIVGIEIAITALEGKWKVSQNKDAKDRAGVEAGLLAEETPQAAEISGLVRRYGS